MGVIFRPSEKDGLPDLGQALGKDFVRLVDLNVLAVSALAAIAYLVPRYSISLTTAFRAVFWLDADFANS